MKIRSNYVSNSSSSSFIVTKDFTNKGLNCLKLTPAQKELINGSKIYDDTINIYPEKDYWITQFISDCEEEKWNMVEQVEHHIYQEGDLGCEPRCPEYYNEYSFDGSFGRSVFLLKEHDEAKQMTFNEFVKQYKKSDLPKEFIVKYESDGIILKYVY